MASITIQHGHKNLVFVANVANQTGAEFEEKGQWITLSDNPRLVIPRYCFDQAFDPEHKRRNDSQLESAWRSLLLNKQGYLEYFGDDEISITDEPPKEERKRPSFLLRFPDQETKSEAEEWAMRAGYDSLTEYVLEALERFNRSWEQKAKD
jgi:hypothetical protein